MRPTARRITASSKENAGMALATCKTLPISIPPPPPSAPKTNKFQNSPVASHHRFHPRRPRAEEYRLHKRRDRRAHVLLPITESLYQTTTPLIGHTFSHFHTQHSSLPQTQVLPRPEPPQQWVCRWQSVETAHDSKQSAAMLCLLVKSHPPVLACYPLNAKTAASDA